MRKSMMLWATFGVLVAGDAAALELAQTDSLNAERVVALARAHAPEVRGAEARVLEAQGRLSGARALARENPTIEGVAGFDDRFERRTQWELSVPIGIGLGWAGRTAAARAELERDRLRLADTRRGVIGVALAAYYRALHAARKVELARERLALAEELRRTALERHRAGDIPRLEVLLAETEEVRAESALLAEEQNATRRRMAVAGVLGLPSGERLIVAGALADRSLLNRALETSTPAPRADVLAAEREVEAAKSAKRLAAGERLPGLAFRLDYGHEEGEPRALPGLAISVPIFQYGQESRAVARARALRASIDLDRTRNAAAAEVEGFTKAYAAAIEAAGKLERRALPQVEESENMVRDGYRSGKIDLSALLVVRRNLLETRRDYSDRLLEAALAAIDLVVAKGSLQ